MRQRVGVVLIKGEEILLIFRRKKEMGEYYVIPGGGAEEGESLVQTAIREIKEETGFDVVLGKYLGQTISPADFRDQTNHFFLAQSFTGELELGGPEAVKNNPDNYFELKWVPLKDVPNLDIKNKEILALI